jgi:hypothetical protein
MEFTVAALLALLFAYGTTLLVLIWLLRALIPVCRNESSHS